MQDDGYIVIILDKDEFASGDLIRGIVVIDLFKPSLQKDIFIQFKCCQKVTNRVAKLVDEASQFNKNQEALIRSGTNPVLNEVDRLGFQIIERKESLNSKAPVRKSSLKSSIHNKSQMSGS